MTKESSARGHCTIFSAVLVAAIVFCAYVDIADAQNQKFQFAVIGDTSYSKVAEQEFERLMAVLTRKPSPSSSTWAISRPIRPLSTESR